ncbi:hypothetical protein BGZ95_004706 [Linnemannia exigua]|uniref:Anaphase-promoting complex subunit CDC26 n=1 Tax=Linnemannia exigua TaxID=604196 RepID=A0AAD4DHC7_9FUNG|nr:hypothetical protein BGZ95_004706 [Linnemannia exigua]
MLLFPPDTKDMLRRDPTRIELRAEDLLDFDRAREEYLDSIATHNNNTTASKNKKHKATAAGPPPPTPANQTTTSSRKPDPVELAERERKGKSAKERIFGSN